MLVRAFPSTPGVDPKARRRALDRYRARGPPESGDVSVGACLDSGVSYHNIVLDGVGDDRGILASKFVTAP